MSFGDFDKKVIDWVSKSRIGRLTLLFTAAIGLAGQAGTTLAPVANYLKSEFIVIAGVKPTADEIKNERYMFLSGFYMKFVQDYVQFASQNSNASQLLDSAEERLASTFEGTSFKYSSNEFMDPEKTLEQRFKAVQALRSRAEVNADRLGSRYRAMFDFGYHLAAMLQRSAEVQVRNASVAELRDLTVSSYNRAKSDSSYKLPALPVESESCKADHMSNQCVADIVASVNLIKDYLHVHV